MKIYIEKENKTIDIALNDIKNTLKKTIKAESNISAKKKKKISDSSSHNMNFKIDFKSLLNYLDINPASVILVKNSAVVLDDEILEDDDELKILSVISGG